MPRSDVVSWMKALGIGLIVYGHVAHASTVALTPPIYLKQLGVAFFLFATGFTLAREQRGAVEVLFNRLFQVYLFGLSAAALITVAGLVSGSGLALSNYLPFIAGANVFFDNFPANPTTWYLGTYVHLLALWALWLRRVRVRPWMVLAALLLEIPIRAMLVSSAGPFVAYMLLTNWAGVFLFGLAQGASPDTAPRGRAAPYALALVGGIAIWSLAIGQAGFNPTFPFMTLDRWPGAAGAVLTSAAVSMLYLSAAGLLFAIGRRLPAPGPITFLARNSLIIFLAHMPVFFALNPVLTELGLSYWAKVAVQLIVCLPGLALVSEGIVRVVRPKALGIRLSGQLTDPRRPGGPGAAAVPSWGNR